MRKYGESIWHLNSLLMKKKKLKNLNLNKIIISQLDPQNTDHIRGGVTGLTCQSCPGPTQSIKGECPTVCNN
ncbi:class I lanthipeptide [Sinomicrobium oceani]